MAGLISKILASGELLLNRGLVDQSGSPLGTVSNPIVTSNSAASGAITVADGVDVTQGSKADAAATDSTSSWSIKALLAGILAQMLSSNPAQIYRADSYLNITGDATTVVKIGAGTFSRLVLNGPTATEVITIYDSLTATGTIIGKITIPATPQPVSLEFGVAFAIGLTIVTATATSDLTAVYR